MAQSGRATRADHVCFEGNNGHDADVMRCLLLTQNRRPRTLVAPVIMGAFKAPYSERLTSELPQLALDFHKSLQRGPLQTDR